MSFLPDVNSVTKIFHNFWDAQSSQFTYWLLCLKQSLWNTYVHLFVENMQPLSVLKCSVFFRI